MADIDTIIAEVRRLRVDENEDDAPECSMCGDTYQLRDGCDKTAVCDLCAQRIAEEYAPSLARACEEQRGEIERLHEDVVRLTRDRDLLAGYVRAALSLTRDAHKHLLEERPEEAARTIYRVIHALASALGRGADR